MLLAWWFLAALIGLAVVVPLAAVALGVRRYRRRKAGLAVIRGWRLALRRTGFVLATATFAVAAILAAVNDHYSYIPSFHALFGNVSPDLVSQPVAARAAVAAARAAAGGAHTGAGATAAGGEVALPAAKRPSSDHGTVEKVSVDGPVSGIGPRDTYVYLPPQYFDPARAAERFPVLYLMHGSPGVSVDWIRAGWLDRAMDDLLSKHRIAPFIVVMPDLNGGFRHDAECEDIPNGPHVQTYVTTDVVAYVDANYRTAADRTARVIGGLSTGGYCAVNLVLRHQDLFSGIVSHSGYDRPDHNAYTGDLFGGDKAAERANTPGDYLGAIPLRSPLGAYIDVGMSDGGSRAESTAMAQTFERRGVPVTFHDFADEAHSWLVWRRNLFSSLPWVSSWFASNGAPTAVDGAAEMAAGPPPAESAAAASGSRTAAAGPRAGAETAPTDSELSEPPDAEHAGGPPPAATEHAEGPPSRPVNGERRTTGGIALRRHRGRTVWSSRPPAPSPAGTSRPPRAGGRRAAS